MARRRSRRRRKGNDPVALLVAFAAIVVILIAVHFWYLTLTGAILGGAGYVAFRRYVGRKATRSEITYHAEMSPEDKARLRAAQKTRTVALGPNATAADRKMFERDNPPPKPVPPDDDIPPF
jgi:hypothetical protein